MQGASQIYNCIKACYNVKKEEGNKMKCLKYIKSTALVLLSAVILTGSVVCTDKVSAQPTAAPAKVETVQAITVSPMAIVNSPKNYLNKTVLMKAKFDKFSTLGLDYKPAFKSSDNYISFLIKREDTTHAIPLSEMKLFLPRETAEKFIDLKTDDEIEIKGVVFSDALGDAWVDVKQLTILKKAPEEKKDGVK